MTCQRDTGRLRTREELHSCGEAISLPAVNANTTFIFRFVSYKEGTMMLSLEVNGVTLLALIKGQRCSGNFNSMPKE